MVGLCALALAASAWAERGIGSTAMTPPETGESRVALVIGNSDYGVGSLRNPVNDATDMAKTLEACGFDVTAKTNVDQAAMETAVEDFGQRIRGAGVALFYYAGHGIQAQGENYLIPLGVNPKAENELRFRCINAGLVLAKMENAGTRVNIVILDACRDNPFARSFRSQAKGLAVMDAAKGTIVAYATAPGQVASDGSGRNGAYTGALLEHMQTPGLPVERLFKQVRNRVLSVTSNEQTPWENTSLTGDFYFMAKPYVIGPRDDRPLIAPPTPPVMTGNLQIAVNAPNTEVTVDGQDAGKASPSEALNIRDLPAGKTTVTVSAAGYKPLTETVEVKKGEWTQVPLQLAKVYVIQGKPKPPAAKVTHGTPHAGETRTFGGIEMVWVPPGSFTMGSKLTPSEIVRKYGGEAKYFEDERPQHEVTLTKGFWMGKYEVTNAQYRRYKSSHDSKDYKGHDLNGDQQPVVYVSWDDAKAFCQWLSRESGETFRLPTEAEWEYACRAGTTTVRYWGDDDKSMGQYANVVDRTAKSEWSDWRTVDTTDGYKVTARVGQFKSNQFGLYDMIGNVYEWCNDWHDDYSSSSATNPEGPASGSSRLLRGGSWYGSGYGCRSAARNYGRPGSARNAYGLGFRVSRTP